ncbi:MAG: Hpt domain-containing protein [Lachnospiraceae bacterium]|nr:Hpt domain-containing protein [Lachnospiraceae bacterium]
MGKNVKDVYALMGEDYDEVIGRLKKDERIEKFLIKFLETKEYNQVVEALKNDDIKAAFESAHTIKGLSLNLGFSKLGSACALFCDNIRDNVVKAPIAPLMDSFSKEYENVCSAIKILCD